MDFLEFIARVTSHIPDKGQVTVRYYGLYSSAHRGKVRKASLEAFPLRIVEDELRTVPSKGWAEMIRKVHEADPMVCPQCGGTMKIIAFLTDCAVVDRIIDHLKLTFVAERPPPTHLAYQEVTGRQGYVVCPLVEESEQLRERIFPDFSVGLVHGRLKLNERAEVMDGFRSRKVSALAATPVIEVGVDVPNATTIVILSAERFGLAQLHQLRGRVARSSQAARCFLVTDEHYRPGLRSDQDDDPVAPAQRRLEVLLETGDGFRIAEEDLRLRGPGEVMGVRQHGLPEFRLANLVADTGLLDEAREAASLLLAEDAALAKPEHAPPARRGRRAEETPRQTVGLDRRILRFGT